ncbi:hypothetical protein Pmar_PMAR003176, partial [Perkinsus marinus ATCC 50983]
SYIMAFIPYLYLTFTFVAAQRNISVTPSRTSPPTTPGPVKYCPIGWCLDSKWFKKRPCITPKPYVLRDCWNLFCKIDANHRGFYPTNSQGRRQGTYCKDWQDPNGRICFHDTSLHCQCDKLHITPFSPHPRDGWSEAQPCSYPPPPGVLTSPPPPDFNYSSSTGLSRSDGLRLIILTVLSPTIVWAI